MLCLFFGEKRALLLIFTLFAYLVGKQSYHGCWMLFGFSLSIFTVGIFVLFLLNIARIANAFQCHS